MALIELLLASWFVPASTSSVWGSLSAYLWSIRVFLFVALPVGMVVLPLDGVFRRMPPLIRVHALLSVFAAAIVGVMANSILIIALSGLQLDFAETEVGLAVLSSLFSVVLSLATYIVSVRLLREPLKRLPAWASTRRVFGLALLGTSVVTIFVGHLVFAKVHLVTLAGVSGGLAVVAAVVGSHALLRSRGRRVSVAALGLVVFLFASLPFDRNAQGRFYLYTAASTTAPIGAALRNFMDRDRDGASPLWLGGADCAEGDPHRGPGMLEIVGDGIDQDCRGGDAQPRPLQVKPPPFRDCISPGGAQSVLLITIDAMRSDAVRRELMPQVHRFSEDAIVYSRAYSPSTMTKPSMGAVMTGQPVALLYRDNALTQDGAFFAQTWATVAAAQSRATMSLNWYPLDETVHAGFALENPGIIDVQPKKGQLLAAGVTNSAIRFVSETDGPFFAWVHYLDAHAPYSLTDDAPLGYPVGSDSAYERGLEYVDYHLGRLLRVLRKESLVDRTVVIITSDHGEELGERGRLGHGPNLFEDTIRVPLFVRVPGCGVRKIDTPASLAWIAPTIARLGALDFQGGDYLPEETVSPVRPVVTEEPPANTIGFKRSIVFDSLKLIVDVQNGGRALFDLKRDPHEEHNIYGADAAKTKSLEDAYQEWLDETARRRPKQ